MARKRVLALFCVMGVGLATLAVLPGVMASPTTFSPNVRVNAVTTWDQRNASMAVGPGGTIHVVWEDYQMGMGPMVSAIYYAKSDNGGATYSIGIPIVNPLPQNVREKFPSITVSSNGWIHIVWTDITAPGTPLRAGVYYARSRTGGASFEAAVAVSDAPMDIGAEFVVPRIAAYGSGVCQLHVIWATDDVTNAANPIYFTYDQSPNCGGIFGLDLLVDPSGYDAALDVALDGTVGVAFAAGTSAQANIYFKMKVGPLWQNAVQVSQYPSKWDRDPTVAFDPSAPPGARRVHVAWADGRNIDPENELTFWNWDVFYSKSANGVNFGPNVRVSDILNPPPARQFSEQSEPWIDMDAGGNPRIAWTDWRNDLDNGHRFPGSPSQDADVYFDESPDGGVTFGVDQRVNDDLPGRGKENSRPMLVIVASDIDIVWQDGREPAYGLDVYFAGTNVPLGSPDSIVINEVMFDPAYPGEQWVEFGNKDPLPVNVRLMEFSDEDTFGFAFPSVTPMVPSGSFIVVHLDAGMDDTYFGQTQPNALHLYTGNLGWQRHSLGLVWHAGGVVAADFDGDGDNDIAVGEGHQPGNGLYVLLRPDDPTEDWPVEIVDQGWGNAWALVAGDIDLDNDIDLLVGEAVGSSAPTHRLTWYENGAWSGPYRWTRHPIETILPDVDDVAISDINNDGFPDIVAATWLTGKSWYENDQTPRDGGWIKHTISSDWGSGIAVANFDAGMLPDVFSSRDWFNPDDDIGWYENGPGWPYHVIRTYTHGGIHSEPPFLDSGDIDGDGDIDVASGATMAPWESSNVFWYENRLANQQADWVTHVVDTDSPGAGIWGGVEVDDVDGDNRLDIVVASPSEGDLTLFRNNLGGNPAWLKEIVDDSLLLANEISIARIDSDYWLDIVATDNTDNQVYWYTRMVLDGRDQISLYTGSVHDSTTIIDFVAWGGDAQTDDDIAIAGGQWPPGGVHVYTTGVLLDQTIGRDGVSTDTNNPADWAIRVQTPGAPNT
jgi:hypothetical protein